jgi:hypothetical protein
LTDQALTDVAQTAYDQLARHAVAVQISTPAGSDAAGRREILRAAFLVPGVEAGAFLSEVESLDESSEGAGCTCSGPWPPYSFVTLEEEPA